MLVPRLPFADRKCKLITSPVRNTRHTTRHAYRANVSNQILWDCDRRRRSRS
jgi:hypothetical protein